MHELRSCIFFPSCRSVFQKSAGLVQNSKVKYTQSWHKTQRSSPPAYHLHNANWAANRKEREGQLWRRLWVAHIGTTLLEEDSVERIVAQLDEVAYNLVVGEHRALYVVTALFEMLPSKALEQAGEGCS